MAVTKLENLVNPEVVADSITADLPAAIKFTPISNVDRTLVGTPGNTIAVPQFQYIGDATEVAEGAAIENAVLTATTVQATIKKVAKGVEITDEALLSGAGKPLDESVRQITAAIASKVDADILAATMEKVGGTGADADNFRALKVGSAATPFSLNLLSTALDAFSDENTGERKFLFVNPIHMGILRTDPTFTHASELGDKTLITGAVGTVYGCEVIPSRRIVQDETDGYLCVLAKEGAVSLFLKREATVETARNITNKTTIITADEHYVTKMRDASKVVLIQNSGAAT